MQRAPTVVLPGIAPPKKPVSQVTEPEAEPAQAESEPVHAEPVIQTLPKVKW